MDTTTRKRARTEKAVISSSSSSSSSSDEVEALDLLQRLTRCSEKEWMAILVENSHHFRNMIKTLQNICGNSPVFRIHLELITSESIEEPLPLFHLVIDSKSVDRTAFVHFKYPIHNVSINEDLLRTKMSKDGLMVDLQPFCIPLDKLSHALNSVGDSKLITLKFGDEDSMEKLFVRGFLDTSSLKSARSDLWSIPLIDLTVKTDEIKKRLQSKTGKSNYEHAELIKYLTESFPVDRLKFIFQVHRLDFADMLSMLRDDTSKETRIQFKIFKYGEDVFVFERVVSNHVTGIRRENRIITKLQETTSTDDSDGIPNTLSSIKIEKNSACMTSSDEDYFDLEGYKPKESDVFYDYKFSSSTLEAIFKHIQKTDDFSIMFSETGQLVVDINRTVINERQSGLFILLQPVVD